MSQPRLLPGKFVWFELLTGDPGRAQAFYGEVLGWKVRPFPMGESSYDMIYVGDTMIGGYAEPGAGQRAHFISYVSVDDVDAAARAATAHGGKVVSPPADAPGVARIARIADPQGAQLCLFKKVTDDPADGDPPNGGWLWNELHTTDPAGAAGFYEKVVGYSARSQDMGPAGTYRILSRDGVDRAGVTGHLPPGTPPHWLPYVAVDDPDAAIARARKLGAKIPMACEDIPAVGRFGVLEDPTGAVLALMKAEPREKPRAS